MPPDASQQINTHHNAVTGETYNTFFLHGTQFNLPPRYAPIRVIGQGAFGCVCSAKDNLTGESVAVKKITNCFTNLTDTKRIIREVKLLRHLRGHENIISLKNIFPDPAKTATSYEEIYLVCALMDTDLQRIIQSPQPLSDDHCQYFIYQILRGLKFLHSANIMHRDLKPSNILCNGDCLLKIADFGLARVVNDKVGFMTEYVATRWYRAPEVILSWKEYSKSIDIWSVGCILAELFLRKPLFQGKDYISQVARITDIIGTPSESDIEGLATEQGKRYIRSLGFKPRVQFSQLFQGVNPLAIDLIEKMLEFNPGKRISVEHALAHPYLASLHDVNDEVVRCVYIN